MAGERPSRIVSWKDVSVRVAPCAVLCVMYKLLLHISWRDAAAYAAGSALIASMVDLLDRRWVRMGWWLITAATFAIIWIALGVVGA